MLIHASCAARDGNGVLLTGPSGAGKSDLLLRLLDRGFQLVADDQVEIEAGIASAPASLAGLIEIRGLGLLHRPFLAQARLLLSILLQRGDRLPQPERDGFGVPLIRLDPLLPSAAQRVEMALDCVLGRARLAVGALAVEQPA